MAADERSTASLTLECSVTIVSAIRLWQLVLAQQRPGIDPTCTRPAPNSSNLQIDFALSQSDSSCSLGHHRGQRLGDRGLHSSAATARQQDLFQFRFFQRELQLGLPHPRATVEFQVLHQALAPQPHLSHLTRSASSQQSDVQLPTLRPRLCSPYLRTATHRGDLDSSWFSSASQSWNERECPIARYGWYPGRSGISNCETRDRSLYTYVITIALADTCFRFNIVYTLGHKMLYLVMRAVL